MNTVSRRDKDKVILVLLKVHSGKAAGDRRCYNFSVVYPWVVEVAVLGNIAAGDQPSPRPGRTCGS
jgi:hypothetical protein